MIEVKLTEHEVTVEEIKTVSKDKYVVPITMTGMLQITKVESKE